MKSFFFGLLLFVPSCLFAQKDGWQTLFNGKDLSGWVQRNGKASYEVKNGIIIGTTVPDQPNSFLCTDKDYP
jgi:hypothetical protein